MGVTCPEGTGRRQVSFPRGAARLYISAAISTLDPVLRTVHTTQFRIRLTQHEIDDYMLQFPRPFSFECSIVSPFLRRRIRRLDPSFYCSTADCLLFPCREDS